MMLPSLWRPMGEEIGTLHRNIDDLFTRVFGSMEGLFGRAPAAGAAAWFPPLECYAEDNEVHVNVLVPGIDPEHVHVTSLGNQLSIKGERHWEEQWDRKRCYWVREIPYGTFERTITLPEAIDPNQVQARFQHGMLEITFPITKAVSPKRIEIQAGEAVTT